MEAFEQLVASLFTQKGYWTRTNVKVQMTSDEKEEIGRTSCPRWDLDVVAYQGRSNKLLVVECKSYFDSKGVDLSDFRRDMSIDDFRDNVVTQGNDRYKLFNEDTLRRVVLGRLGKQLVENGYCADKPEAQLCLAAGNVHGDKTSLEDFFEAKGWGLFANKWVYDELSKLSEKSYENSTASVVSKVLLRD